MNVDAFVCFADLFQIVGVVSILFFCVVGVVVVIVSWCLSSVSMEHSWVTGTYLFMQAQGCNVR